MEKFVSGLPNMQPRKEPTLDEALARFQEAVDNRRKRRRFEMIRRTEGTKAAEEETA